MAKNLCRRRRRRYSEHCPNYLELSYGGEKGLEEGGKRSGGGMNKTALNGNRGVESVGSCTLAADIDVENISIKKGVQRA